MTTPPLRTAALVLALALASATTACVAPPGGAAGGGDDETIGRVTLALYSPPSDALCLRLTTESATLGLKVVKMIPLTANVMNSSLVQNLPTGTVTMLGEGFGVACASVTAASVMNWVSDKITVVIPLDEAPKVTLVLKRAARVNLGVDFAPNAVFEDVALPAIASRMAAAPDNSVVMTMKTGSWIYRMSNPFDSTKLASPLGIPKYVTVGSDGTVLVTSQTSPTATTATLSTFTAAGVAKTTYPIPFVAGDLAYDAAGTAWIGSTAAGQVLRVAAAATAPSGLAITLAGSTSASGLTLGADGNLRVFGAPGQMGVLKPDGTNLGAVIQLGLVPRDGVVHTDGTAFIQSTTGVVIRVSAAGVVLPGAFGGGLTVTESAIVSTAKGVVWGDTQGILNLGLPDGTVTSYIIPEFSPVGGLAVLPNGKLWVSDATKPRAWIVTLP